MAYSAGVAVSQTSPVWATKAGLGSKARISRKQAASRSALLPSAEAAETWVSVMWTKVKSARVGRVRRRTMERGRRFRMGVGSLIVAGRGGPGPWGRGRHTRGGG